MQYDILIIGAGAAGLFAAGKLAEKGFRVALLEATGRAGGRIATLTQNEYGTAIETGAEFIHGGAKFTLELLDKANLNYHRVEGQMVTIQNGVWLTDERPRDELLLSEKLKQIDKDCTIDQFLDKNFPISEFEILRRSVQQFAEGFSLADTGKASARAFQKEWNQMDEVQYRVVGGYQEMINYLLDQCTQFNAAIFINSPVVNVEHAMQQVSVYTSDNKQYTAKKLIVTVSVGVLQSGILQFKPVLSRQDPAIQQLAFGSVIKFLYRFKTPFWEERSRKIGFLLSDELVPTWWTQLPKHSSLLTGWLGGPKAKKAQSLSAKSLHEMALSSLSGIWQIDKNHLQQDLLHYDIISWDNHPYIKGGYSYNTVASQAAKEILQKPVNGTIYFAGEAIYSGDSQGTVEAALGSASSTIELILKE